MQTGWVIYRHLAYFSTSNVPLDRNNYPCTEVNSSGIPISAYGNKQAAKIWNGVDIYGETVPGSTHTYNELYDIVSRYDVNTVGQSSPIQVGGITVAEYRGQSADLCPATKTLGLSSPPTIFSSTGGSQARTVTSLVGQESQNWSASLLTTVSWVHLSTSGTGNGATLTITVDESTSGTQRSIVLRLTQTTTGETRDYTIAQESVPYQLITTNRTYDPGIGWFKAPGEIYYCSIFDPNQNGVAGATGSLSIGSSDSFSSGNYIISGYANSIFKDTSVENDYLIINDGRLQVKDSCILKVDIPSLIDKDTTSRFWYWFPPADVHLRVRVNALRLVVEVPEIGVSYQQNLEIAYQQYLFDDEVFLKIPIQSVEIPIDFGSTPPTTLDCTVDLVLDWECISITGEVASSGDVFQVNLIEEEINLYVKPL